MSDDLAIPTKVIEKIIAAKAELDNWKEGLSTDYDARSTISYNLCTALAEFVKVKEYNKVLADMFKIITEDPKYRQLG
jgi:hypothetical protein